MIYRFCLINSYYRVAWRDVDAAGARACLKDSQNAYVSVFAKIESLVRPQSLLLDAILAWIADHGARMRKVGPARSIKDAAALQHKIVGLHCHRNRLLGNSSHQLQRFIRGDLHVSVDLVLAILFLLIADGLESQLPLLPVRGNTIICDVVLGVLRPPTSASLVLLIPRTIQHLLLR